MYCSETYFLKLFILKYDPFSFVRKVEKLQRTTRGKGKNAHISSQMIYPTTVLCKLWASLNKGWIILEASGNNTGSGFGKLI